MNLKEEQAASQKQEIDKLRDFVSVATEKVNSNNDDIYEKYDDKIKKIKEVCAQYFSKYEKHMINQQTIVKDLERQQDQWVNMLIKPQELNQARLYAIETRMAESDQAKVADVEFLKETMKKLIYAIEQSQVALVRRGSLLNKEEEAPVSHRHNETMTATLSKKLTNQDYFADASFSQSQGSNLPTLIRGKKQQLSYKKGPVTIGVASSNRKESFFASGPGSNNLTTDTGSNAKPGLGGLSSARDSLASTRGPGASEILFFKRLLYLKASIDNDQTLDTFSVPFEQEKARDAASPDQLLLDTQAVLSARGEALSERAIDPHSLTINNASGMGGGEAYGAALIN